MICPFREEHKIVSTIDIEGNPLEVRTSYTCTMREDAPCIYCTHISIFNRNTTSQVIFYRPDGREEMIYGNY